MRALGRALLALDLWRSRRVLESFVHGFGGDRKSGNIMAERELSRRKVVPLEERPCAVVVM